MLFAGLTLGTVGTEAQYGVERFTFGVRFLRTGVDFVTVLIGLFAIGAGRSRRAASWCRMPLTIGRALKDPARPGHSGSDPR